MPKLVSNYTCLVIILISFNLKKDENYYSQVLLKECKYTKKETPLVEIQPLTYNFFLMSLMKNKLEFLDLKM